MNHGVKPVYGPLSKDYNHAICGLSFVTNFQKLGPYADCTAQYSTTIPEDQNLSEFISSQAIFKAEENFILGFKAKVCNIFFDLHFQKALFRMTPLIAFSCAPL